MALQIRRGTNEERLNPAFTPLIGELIYDTTLKQVFVGDGTTSGGISIGGGEGGGGPTLAYSISADTAGSGVNLTLTDSNLLTDAVTFAPGAGITVTKTGASTISIAATGTSGATSLDGLSDVVISGVPITDQILKYDGTNWVNAAAPTGGTTVLDGLTDVDLTTTPLALNQVLTYDGTNWVNAIPAIDSLAGTTIDNPVDGEILTYVTGAGWVNSVFTGLLSISEDTTPTLGGNLDLNNFDITGFGNIDIAGTVSAQSVVTSNLEAVADINFNYLESAVFNGKNILLSNANADPSIGVASSIIFQSSRGTVEEPQIVELGDKLSTYSAAGWTGSQYRTLGGVSIGVSAGTTGSEDLPGLLSLFVRDDDGGTNAFAQLDGAGVFTTPALQSYGLSTSQKTAVINKYGGVGVGEDMVKGMIVYDTDLNKLTTFHPIQGWGDILTSTAPVTSSSYFKVGVFADNTARDTAVGTPAAGMIVFNTTSGKFEGYTGSAWVALN
jgi:hypothetical protein